jgi:anti-anti-sigma factor
MSAPVNSAASTRYSFYEPAAIQSARDAITDVSHARRRRTDSTRRRTAWYEFQELRIIRDRLWTDLVASQQRLGLRACRSRLAGHALYSFAVGTEGVRRLVRRPGIAGAAAGPVLQWWTEQVFEGTVLHVEGEVDLSTASEWEKALTWTLTQHRRIIVDLSDLDYLDGTGLEVLEKTAEAQRGRLVVAGCKPTLHRVFDILRLGDVLPLVATVEAARNYLRLHMTSSRAGD